MFDSAKLKIERADYHIDDLERQLIDFHMEHLNASITTRDHHRKTDITLTRTDAPPVLALVLGDAIHNLRSALDHVAYDMVIRDGGDIDDRNLHFPIGEDRRRFEAACDRIKTPS